MRSTHSIRKAVTALGVLLLVAGCERTAPERKPEPAVPETAAAEPASLAPVPEPAAEPVAAVADPGSGFTVELGLRLGAGQRAEGTVLSFAPGDPVCVSVTAPAASASGSADRASAAWYSSHEGRDTELGRVEGEFSGSPGRVGWCLPGAERLALGSYRLDVAVDGQEAASTQITVTEARELPRSTGS
jgi:hypothetical protein